MEPRVCAIIPCFNQAKTITEAVDSVKHNGYPHLEIIVVDDGSTDEETLRILDTLEGARVMQQENQGVSVARNTGLHATDAPLVFLLDGDDMVAPGFIRRAVDALERNPNIAYVYSHMKLIGDVNRHWRRPQYNFYNLLWENTVNSSALVRREAVVRVGGFNPALRTYEDWDFWIRLGKQGFHGHRLNEYSYLYRQHGANARILALKERDHHTKNIHDAHPDIFQNERRLDEIKTAWNGSSSKKPFVRLKNTLRTRYGSSFIWNIPRAISQLYNRYLMQ